MFWFFVPVLIVALIIAVAVAILAGSAWRRGGDGRQSGQTIYDEEDQQHRRADAPPA